MFGRSKSQSVEHARRQGPVQSSPAGAALPVQAAPVIESDRA